MKVVEVLAEKYGFKLEEAMSSLKSVKSVKKAKKVEVSDIFAEMTREGDGVVEVVVVKEKKPRTSAQLIAFEKMRVKRAEKLAEKELEKEREKRFVPWGLLSCRVGGGGGGIGSRPAFGLSVEEYLHGLERAPLPEVRKGHMVMTNLDTHERLGSSDGEALG